MSTSLQYPAPWRNGRSPAWSISLAMHVGVILVLCTALQQSPRGTGDLPFRSAEIVLNPNSASGGDGESDGKVPDGLPDAVEAPELLASPPAQQAPVEPLPPVNLVAQVAPSQPAKTSTKQTNTPRRSTGLRGAPGGSDKYAKVSVFGVEGKGNKFVYVFDRSSSMEGPPLAAAKRQLIESLKSLEAVHQFHIIFFNQRMKSLDITGGGGRIAFASDRNKQLAANFIGGISADGGTDRFPALKQAFAFQPDVIFFLSDADDPMPASELADLAKLHERFGTAICVIEFGRDPAPPENNFLKELARQSGGQYGYVNAAKLAR
jgi:Ca-activated chloride channel family protein